MPVDESAPPSHEISPTELRLRVLYAFVQVAAELGAVFGVGLKTFERLGHMAAFHALRRRGLALGSIAGRLGVSRRKADQLSRLLKDNFFDRSIATEDADALQRRVEFMLWAEPMSAARLKQVLRSVDPDEVDVALSALRSAGRVADAGGVFQPTTPERRLVRDDWLARIGGLNHQLGAVGGAALARLFHDDPRAFARTLSLRVRRDQADRLEALYRDVLWPALVELDAECQGLPPSEVQPLALSLCWGPVDAIAHQDLPEGDPE